MDVGRVFSVSVLTNGGVLPLAAAVVVLLVLWWAISSPAWDVSEEPAESAPPRPAPARPVPVRNGTRPAGGHGATAALPRPVGTAAYSGPRHAAGPSRSPKVSGSPPWGPAPRPPGFSPPARLSPRHAP